MTPIATLRLDLDGTLDLLSPYVQRAREVGDTSSPLPSLLEQCQQRCEANQAGSGRVIRTVHHFACSGGTLIARALSAQPNCTLLSEVDPFARKWYNTHGFSPTDLIQLSKIGLNDLPDAVTGQIFLGGLDVLETHVRSLGRDLVLRDHTHSHFCTATPPEDRPLIKDVLQERFTLRSIVTVRHPLDSYLSLTSLGWMHFSPATLQEYALRYMRFLDSYPDVPVFRYEDFVADPETTLQSMTAELGMSFQSGWQDILPTIWLSGDSGRKGVQIQARARRRIPPAVAAQEKTSPNYETLCHRLGYEPAFVPSEPQEDEK